jgi:hypothetical protein
MISIAIVQQNSVMSLKTFIATLSEQNVIVVQASEDLPELIHAAFYTHSYEAFLVGQAAWTSESEALALHLIEAMAAEHTSIEH